MSSGFIKNIITILVTPSVEFALLYNYGYDLRIGLTDAAITATRSGSDSGYYELLTISQDAITAIEYCNKHVYIHRSNSQSYVDLNFELVPYMLESTRKIFDNIQNDIIKYPRSFNSINHHLGVDDDDGFDDGWCIFIDNLISESNNFPTLIYLNR